jgi:GNAT superfamily N-acetyltransferase
MSSSTNTVVLRPCDDVDSAQRRQIRDFLNNQLGSYGDVVDSIGQAIDFSLSDDACEGGYIVVERAEDHIAASVVVNETGMSNYIPENILVYIAVHEDHRGEGLGKKVLSRAQEAAEGDIALHVEEGNPAIHLFRSLDFEKKYVEMRWETSES